MAGTNDREVIKTFDFSNYHLMSDEDKAKFSKIVTNQLKIKVEIHEVVSTLMSLANSDITDFLEYDENGDLVPVKDLKGLPLEKRKQLKEFNVNTDKKYSKDGTLLSSSTKVKIATHDKVKILEHLQKHLDMWGDNKAGGTGQDKMTQFLNEVDSIVKNAVKKRESLIVDAE